MPIALVVSQSRIQTDSRVVRQLEWLLADGWEVDTLGLGPKPLSSTRTHFEMAGAPRWTGPKLVKGIIHTLLPYRTRFRLLSQSRIASRATALVNAGEYDLILFDDIYLIPWVGDRAKFNPPGSDTRVHLDIHEYHPPDLPRGTPGAIMANAYYRWVREFIGSPAFDSRSVVGDAYADIYSREFSIPRPAIVRNAPPEIKQRPQPVEAERVHLLYHGGADWKRGFRQLVDAVPKLEERFDLTFMLTGSESVVSDLKELCRRHHGRIHFVDAVPVSKVARAINTYDLEVMFYPPVSENLRMALPNKLFEAVQGRLGLVVGDSPSMVAIVEQFANGVIVEGWTGRDLATALNKLTHSDISAFKLASHEAATELNAEHEARTFLETIGTAKG